MNAKATLLDHVLTAYGPDAAEVRAQFREAVAERVARAQVGPIGQTEYRVYAAILGLSPRDDMQRDLKARAATLAMDLGQLRMLLLARGCPRFSSHW